MILFRFMVYIFFSLLWFFSFTEREKERYLCYIFLLWFLFFLSVMLTQIHSHLKSHHRFWSLCRFSPISIAYAMYEIFSVFRSLTLTHFDWLSTEYTISLFIMNKRWFDSERNRKTKLCSHYLLSSWANALVCRLLPIEMRFLCSHCSLSLCVFVSMYLCVCLLCCLLSTEIYLANVHWILRILIYIYAYEIHIYII